MNPYLNDEHESLRRSVREFAEAEIAPVAAALDEESRFPWENVKKMAELGYFGVNVPKQYGGLGLDYLSYLLVIEELARVDASHAITVSAHSTLGTSPILNFGSDAQRDRYLPLLARGQVLAGFGLTEPGAGSDASATRTVAVETGSGFRITGSKIFITHAGVGEVFVITAVTDRDRGKYGISSFIVTKETVDREIADRLGIGHAPELEPFTPGVRAGKKEDKMGWRASDTRELLLDNAEVPAENMLGERGQGFINFMKTLDAGRIGIGALALGIAQGAFDQALRFTGSRRQFDRPIRDFQGVQFTLADMATEIEAARHLVYHAAWLKERGLPYTRAAAMAKLYASELAMRVTTRAVQLHGAYGYTNEYPVERMMRDAKICEIGEGTSEVQRMVIARNIFREADGAVA
ncbi:MAG TPA: acyl-CoA dehydrogenase family protein [Longimicrobiales bacterium]|nr:acyl-CoA dehydrogenase family protein [Longimicrobiales bacterium]